MSAVLLAQGALMRGFNPPGTVPINIIFSRARAGGQHTAALARTCCKALYATVANGHAVVTADDRCNVAVR